MAELEAALAALQMGIQTEIDGYDFYLKFAAQTEDPDARAMFERLAQDEVTHLELLRKARAALEENGVWTEYQGLPSSLVEGAPIFSRERVKENVVAYTSDLSALRVAYLIEKDAADFYRRAAQETDDSNGKQMYLDLVKMEEGHLALLQGEYNYLRDRFQVAMGFAPF